MIEKLQAIVINVKKYGDSSKIVEIFSKERGRISILAKGARNAKSKFAASLEIFNIIDAQIYFKPNRDLHLLSSAEPIFQSIKISAELEKLAIGISLAEILSKILEKDYINTKLWDLTSETILKLNKSSIYSKSLFIWYLQKLTKLIGYEMSINFNDLPSENSGFFLSLSDGSPQFNSFLPDVYRLSRESISALSFFDAEIDFNGEIQLPESNYKEIFNFFCRYLSYHLEKPIVLKSQELLS